ncbi:hypothetical protein D3C87_1727960 [compost metagenome]
MPRLWPKCASSEPGSTSGMPSVFAASLMVSTICARSAMGWPLALMALQWVTSTKSVPSSCWTTFRSSRISCAFCTCNTVWVRACCTCSGTWAKLGASSSAARRLASASREEWSKKILSSSGQKFRASLKRTSCRNFPSSSSTLVELISTT